MTDLDDDFEELPAEPAWLALERATVRRKQLLAAGYLPLPVNGKTPPIPGRQDIVATDAIIDTWKNKYFDSTNTGIITRTTPSIDIDVLDAAVADEIQELAEKMIGTSSVRTGRAPKRAMMYRTDAPFDKVATPVFISPDGRTHRVEVMGWGQQIVVHGIHPDTHAPYTWHGGEPGPALKRDALPVLTAETAKAFVVAAASCMAAHGWTPQGKPNGATTTSSSLDTGRPASERERLYAQAALDGCADELAQVTAGQRNDTLNKKAFRLGRMVARNWISAAEVTDALFAAAAACGLNADDGEVATRMTIESGLANGCKHRHPNLDGEAFTEQLAVDVGAIRLFWHGEDTGTATRAWLIRNMLPETGTGLVSGQWGTYKTFAALDLAAAVMAGTNFIDHPVARRGGVLFVAAEGASEIDPRLRAVLEAKHPELATRAPFTWADSCPPLLHPAAVAVLVQTAKQANERLRAEFDMPLALIVIDTIAATAGFTKSGEENDAAVAATIMSRLLALSRATGALVLGVDHFGKNAEVGTRGSSAKEASADVVLALLGEKSITGAVTNTRLALRKNRAGPSGTEFPFAVREVETLRDDEQMTSLVIDWNKAAESQSAKPDDRWTKSLRLLRQVLMNILADLGKELRPFADGPIVRAVDIEVVRAEFYKCHPADGDEKAKASARRQAFNRALKAAQATNLIAVREVDGVQWVWLAIAIA